MSNFEFVFSFVRAAPPRAQPGRGARRAGQGGEGAAQAAHRLALAPARGDADRRPRLVLADPVEPARVDPGDVQHDAVRSADRGHLYHLAASLVFPTTRGMDRLDDYYFAHKRQVVGAVLACNLLVVAGLIALHGNILREPPVAVSLALYGTAAVALILVRGKSWNLALLGLILALAGELGGALDDGGVRGRGRETGCKGRRSHGSFQRRPLQGEAGARAGLPRRAPRGRRRLAGPQARQHHRRPATAAIASSPNGTTWTASPPPGRR